MQLRAVIIVAILGALSLGVDSCPQAQAKPTTIIAAWSVPSGGYSPSVVYRIYRNVNSSQFTLLAVVQQPALQYVDQAVMSKQRYCYYMTAFDGVLESSPTLTLCKNLP